MNSNPLSRSRGKYSKFEGTASNSDPKNEIDATERDYYEEQPKRERVGLKNERIKEEMPRRNQEQPEGSQLRAVLERLDRLEEKFEGLDEKIEFIAEKIIREIKDAARNSQEKRIEAVPMKTREDFQPAIGKTRDQEGGLPRNVGYLPANETYKEDQSKSARPRAGERERKGREENEIYSRYLGGGKGGLNEENENPKETNEPEENQNEREFREESSYKDRRKKNLRELDLVSDEEETERGEVSSRYERDVVYDAYKPMQRNQGGRDRRYSSGRRGEENMGEELPSRRREIMTESQVNGDSVKRMREARRKEARQEEKAKETENGPRTRNTNIRTRVNEEPTSTASRVSRENAYDKPENVKEETRYTKKPTSWDNSEAEVEESLPTFPNNSFGAISPQESEVFYSNMQKILNKTPERNVRRVPSRQMTPSEEEKTPDIQKTAESKNPPYIPRNERGVARANSNLTPERLRPSPSRQDESIRNPSKSSINFQASALPEKNTPEQSYPSEDAKFAKETKKSIPREKERVYPSIEGRRRGQEKDLDKRLEEEAKKRKEMLSTIEEMRGSLETSEVQNQLEKNFPREESLRESDLGGYGKKEDGTRRRNKE